MHICSIYIAYASNILYIKTHKGKYATLLDGGIL